MMIETVTLITIIFIAIKFTIIVELRKTNYADDDSALIYMKFDVNSAKEHLGSRVSAWRILNTALDHIHFHLGKTKI